MVSQRKNLKKTQFIDVLIRLPLQASLTQTGVDPEQAAVLPHLQVLLSAHLFVVPVQSPSSLHS